jgi:hypothetical protein
LSRKYAFYSLLNNIAPNNFTEETYNSMYTGIQKEGLGVYIDFAAYKPKIDGPAISATPSMIADAASFKTTGLGGMLLYYTLQKGYANDNSGYAEKDLPSDSIVLNTTEWMKDPITSKEVKNGFTGSSRINYYTDDGVVDRNNAYLSHSMDCNAIAGGIDLITDLYGSGLSRSFQNETMVYKWTIGNQQLFTITSPNLYDWGTDPNIPSVNRPVSLSEFYSNDTYQSITNWYGIKNDTKKFWIKSYKDVVGWN